MSEERAKNFIVFMRCI